MDKKVNHILIELALAVAMLAAISAASNYQRELDKAIAKNVQLSSIISYKLHYCKQLEQDPTIARNFRKESKVQL